MVWGFPSKVLLPFGRLLVVSNHKCCDLPLQMLLPPVEILQTADENPAHRRKYLAIRRWKSASPPLELARRRNVASMHWNVAARGWKVYCLTMEILLRSDRNLDINRWKMCDLHRWKSCSLTMNILQSIVA